MSIYESYAFYTSNGSAVDGLSVSCNIYSSASGLVVSGSPVLDLGGGFYKCAYNATEDGNYLFKFFTSSSIVDSAVIPAMYADKTEIPQTVWNHASRTLTGLGTIVADIWNYATRTLTSIGTTIPYDIWSYPARSLTQVSVEDPSYPVIVSTDVFLYTHASNAIVISGVPDEDEIWFTVKKNASISDEQSLIQISKTAGLLYVNGASASSMGVPSSSGCIVAVDGNVGIWISSLAAPAITGYLQNEYKGEIKVSSGNDDEMIISQFNVIVNPSLTRSLYGGPEF